MEALSGKLTNDFQHSNASVALAVGGLLEPFGPVRSHGQDKCFTPFLLIWDATFELRVWSVQLL